MQIYILEKQEQCGPFTLAELQAKIEAGECTPQTLAWHAGETEWQELEKFLKQNAAAKVVALPETQGDEFDPTKNSSAKASTVRDSRWKTLANFFARAMDTTRRSLRWYRGQRLGVRLAILIIPLVFIAGVVGVGKKAESGLLKATDEERYAIFKGTPFYTRSEVVRELEKAAIAEGDEYRKLREKLEKSGDEILASTHVALRLINKNSESGYWEFAPLKGLSSSTDRIWVKSHFLMGEDNMHGFHIITGHYVFDGREGIVVERATISTLGELVRATMTGKVSLQTAKLCTFMPEAQEGHNVRQVDDYQIYQGVRGYRDSFTSDFAIMCHSDGSSDFRVKPLRIVGMKGFTTKAGLVRQIPEVRAVDDPRGLSKTPQFKRKVTIIAPEGASPL